MRPYFRSCFAVIASLLSAVATHASEGGYLFATFKGEQTPMSEQIYFGLSKDGRSWTALNGGEPVLVSKVGEKGVRDPFLLRSNDGKTFYLIATDLSIHLNGDWNRAQRKASKSIVIWESNDLVKWSQPRLVKVAAPDAGCTWAPEAVYDEENRDYLVFWASRNRSDDFAKQRIWAARTKDFRRFSEPFVYIEKPSDIIDTTIVRENGRYYRFSKDESVKAVTMEASEKLSGPWTDVQGYNLSNLRGYEGPSCYLLQPTTAGKPAMWCLVLDHYAVGQGYKPYISEDLSAGKFTEGPGFTFPFRFRHGSILSLEKGEFERLEKGLGKVDKK